jgi:mannonate dehydratase
MKTSPRISRRHFLGSAAMGATALSLARPMPGATAADRPDSGAGKPVLMKAGHQHDHSETTLRALAAFGVTNICSGQLTRDVAKDWSVDALVALRRHVESFGIKLDCVPLPMNSRDIAKAEMPEILLGKDPQRDRAIEDICTMIRNCGKAGIPMAKYNLTFIGVVRTERTVGRGGASLSSFDYAKSKQEPALTEAGRITEEIYWDRIEYFLKRVVPVATEAKVKIACHPQDPRMPAGTGWRGVETVLGTPEGLRRFVETVPSAYHGLNFCQGTVAEMLTKPGEQIYDVIRDFGRRGKIFNVHFRNIRGAMLKFEETFPDDGDVDMPRALRVYREIGYDGLIMPDHVPQILGDPNGQKAFAFCFGYIQALLQQLRREA